MQIKKNLFLSIFCACLACSEFVSAEDDIVAAPAYTKVEPNSEWDRYISDSATSITEWKRWWQYLSLKKPTKMAWINGLNIWIYPKNEICRSMYVRGIYDPNMAVFVQAFLPKGGVLLDVGANMGYFSLIAAQFDSLCKVIAVEPSSRDYKRLVQNIELNSLSDRVKSVMIAVGDRLGKKNIQIAPEERNGLNTLGAGFAYKGIEKEAVEEVNVTTIDSIVNGEGLDRVDVIKLDIEGSEVRALEGARDTINSYRPVIIVGVNSDALVKSNRSIRDLENIIAELNYDMYKRNTEEFGLKKIDSLVGIKGEVVVCLPRERTEIPQFPNETKRTFMQKIGDFFCSK